MRWFGKYLDLVSVAVKVSFSASLVASGLLLLKVPFEQLALKGNRSLLSKPDKYLCESMLACTIPTFVEQMFAGSFPPAVPRNAYQYPHRLSHTCLCPLLHQYIHTSVVMTVDMRQMVNKFNRYTIHSKIALLFFLLLLLFLSLSPDFVEGFLEEPPES